MAEIIVIALCIIGGFYVYKSERKQQESLRDYMTRRSIK